MGDLWPIAQTKMNLYQRLRLHSGEKRPLHGQQEQRLPKHIMEEHFHRASLFNQDDLLDIKVKEKSYREVFVITYNSANPGDHQELLANATY